MYIKSSLLCFLAILLMRSTAKAQQFQDSCNSTGLSHLQFELLDLTPQDDWSSEEIFWWVELSNGTVVQTCDHEWGCEMTNRNLTVSMCLDLTQGCHRLILLGNHYDRYSARVILDKTEIDYKQTFHKHAVDIGECESCSESESEVELFIVGSVHQSSIEDPYEILPTMSWNIRDGEFGEFRRDTRNYYVRTCVDSCTELSISVPYGSTVLDVERNETERYRNSLDMAVLVDGVVYKMDNWVALDSEEYYYEATFPVGSCSVDDLCQSHEYLLQVDVSTGDDFNDKWWYWFASVLDEDGFDGYSKIAEDTWKQMPGFKYRSFACLPRDNCATLVSEIPEGDTSLSESVELRAFVNGEEIAVRDTCANTRNANSQHICDNRHLHDDWIVVPLGGEKCKVLTSTQRNIAIVVPAVIVAFGLICVVCNLGYRRLERLEQEKDAKKSWATPIPVVATAVANDAPGNSSNNDTENGLASDDASDDEC